MLPLNASCASAPRVLLEVEYTQNRQVFRSTSFELLLVEAESSTVGHQIASCSGQPVSSDCNACAVYWRGVKVVCPWKSQDRLANNDSDTARDYYGPGERGVW